MDGKQKKQEQNGNITPAWNKIPKPNDLHSHIHSWNLKLAHNFPLFMKTGRSLLSSRERNSTNYPKEIKKTFRVVCTRVRVDLVAKTKFVPLLVANYYKDWAVLAHNGDDDNDDDDNNTDVNDRDYVRDLMSWWLNSLKVNCKAGKSKTVSNKQ